MDKKNRYVTRAGWIAGKLREVGEAVPLTDAEAQYLGHQISDTPPKKRAVRTVEKETEVQVSGAGARDDKRRN